MGILIERNLMEIQIDVPERKTQETQLREALERTLNDMNRAYRARQEEILFTLDEKADEAVKEFNRRISK